MRGGCVPPIIGLSSSGSSCGVTVLVFVDDFLISPDVGTLILGGSNVELRLCCDGKGDEDD